MNYFNIWQMSSKSN